MHLHSINLHVHIYDYKSNIFSLKLAIILDMRFRAKFHDSCFYQTHMLLSQHKMVLVGYLSPLFFTRY